MSLFPALPGQLRMVRFTGWGGYLLLRF